jgi:hypothetical protein
MDSGMGLDLARYHIADMLRDAEEERLNRLLPKRERTGAIDAVGFRARIARLVGGLAALRPGGPRHAGA